MTVSFISSNTTSGNAASLTINQPAGLVQNDMMIVSLGVFSEADSLAVTAPTGWTEILSDGGSTASSNHHYVYYKVHTGAGEAASYNFTWAGAEPYAAASVGYRGTRPTIDIFASAENAVDVNNFDAPSVNAVGVSTMLTLFCVDDNVAGLPTFTPPAGQTERVDVNSTVDVDDVGLSINDELIAAAGATGVRNSTGSGIAMWSAVSLLLIPRIRLLTVLGVGI